MNLRVPLLLLLLLLFLPPQPSSSSSDLNPNVFEADASNCTNIPYPFGVRNLSSFIPGFEIDCNVRGGLPTLSIGTKKLQLLNISVQEGYVRGLLSPLAFGYCSRGLAAPTTGISLEGTPFSFSDTRNKYTVIGCDAMVVFQGPGGSHAHNDIRGCVAFCASPFTQQSMVNGYCSGIGCCQAAVPRGLKSFNASHSSIRNLTHCHVDNSTCSEVFLVDQNDFTFSARDVNTITGSTTRPVVLDWAIGNETCDEVKHRNKSELACGHNSDCYDSPNGGYRCNCSQGYAGNPYLSTTQGCTDIDECSYPHSNPCVWKCINMRGSFHCPCPPGSSGDGKHGGSGCQRDTFLEIGLGVGLSLLVMIVGGGTWVYFGLQRRRLTKVKQQHFLQNGGLLLQQHVSSREFSARIFTIEELERATDNFDEVNVVGRGGHGTVYRGVLPDQQVVAIKRSKFMDESQIEHFINEVAILFRIRHRNVVRLLGCCLETQIPLLVYEFVSNGSLFQHLHESGGAPPLSWETRLRIAAETAGALAFLHCKPSAPVIHRDVKSANILLDENYTAKVSDFGASRLVPLNQTHVTTLVQGTLGYLDPEYFHTSQLTEKSDVYSFGVVLLELLTSEKPISFCRSETARNLVAHFYTYLKENNLLNLVDARLVEEAGAMQLLAIAQVAKTCVALESSERPTMKELAVELSALSRLMKRHAELRRPQEEEDGSSQRLAPHGSGNDVGRDDDAEMHLLWQDDDGSSKSRGNPPL
uniref:Protein kinase domain-containing protein n=1 Tax=Musa acuminata subsp. malaccensis TaxID=214687 RepID=A0A804L4R2_MUSAM|nr:PREDICTED: wall-associated receptor kinase 5-like [Musa acuminata subsp. malaccensis]